MQRLLCYDLKHGVLFQWKKYVAVAMLTIFSCISFYVHYKSKLTMEPISFGDYLFWNFRGMKVIEQTNTFIIPNGFWIALNMFLSVLIGSYPAGELSGLGEQRFMRLKKRTQWWTSKYIWCLLSVAAYYAVILLVLLTAGLITGGLKQNTGMPQPGVAEMLGGSAYHTAFAFWSDIGLLMLISTAISLVQMVLSLAFDPKLGYVFSAAVFVLSIYFVQGFSLGNYLMLIRLSNHDMSPASGAAVGILLTAVCYGIGRMVIRRKDICKKHTE